MGMVGIAERGAWCSVAALAVIMHLPVCGRHLQRQRIVGPAGTQAWTRSDRRQRSLRLLV
jgi:hypothetical protein